MPTRCLIKTVKHLEVQDLQRDLKEIVHNKFQDLLTIKQFTSKDEICHWDISYDNIHKFPVSLKTNQQLEFEHPDDNFALWVQYVIEDYLALKYNAQMLDEEYPNQKFLPASEQHTTFIHFLECMLGHHSQQWKQAIIAIELSHLPPALKKLF